MGLPPWVCTGLEFEAFLERAPHVTRPRGARTVFRNLLVIQLAGLQFSLSWLPHPLEAFEPLSWQRKCLLPLRGFAEAFVTRESGIFTRPKL